MTWWRIRSWRSPKTASTETLDSTMSTRVQPLLRQLENAETNRKKNIEDILSIIGREGDLDNDLDQEFRNMFAKGGRK